MNPNTRTRYEVRWSTNPALVGYPDNQDHRDRAESSFAASDPDFVGTARQCLEYRRERKNEIGANTFSRWEFRRRAGGEVVPAHELEQITTDANFSRSHS